MNRLNKRLLWLCALLLTLGSVCAAGEDGKPAPNLFKNVRPTLGGGAEACAEQHDAFHLPPGGSLSVAGKAVIGKGLTHYQVKTAVSVRGDGIARIRLSITGEKEQSMTVTLTPGWLSHSLAWPPPGKGPTPMAGGEDAIELRVEVLGNNVAYVRDPRLEVRVPAKTEPEPEEDLPGLLELEEDEPKKPKKEPLAAKPKPASVEPPPGCVNVAPLATVRVSPFGSLIYRVRDGDDGTGIIPESIGEGRCGSFEFTFERPLPISFLRFYQIAKRYVVLADEDGDGDYERVIADVCGHPTSWYDTDWVAHAFDPPVKARGVKLVNITNNMALMEIEIYVPEDQAPDLPALPALEPGVPEIADGAEVQVQDPAEPYMKGVVVEPWMFPWHGWRMDKEKRPLSEFPHFKQFAADLKDWGTNLVEIFPPTTFVGPNEISPDRGARLWPSKYARHSIKENDLTKICDAFHALDMKVFVMQRPPYWCGWKADERDKEKDFAKRYAWEVERWAGLNLEIIESGADGVSLCFDEQYAGGMPDREEFKRRFGYETIEGGDTECGRKWRVFTYEAWGKFMADSLALMRGKTDRRFAAFTRVSAYEAYTNSRPRYGTCYDLLGGTLADLDYFGTDPYHTQEGANIGHYNCAAFTKRLLAASKKKQIIVTLNPPWTDAPKWFTRFPPVSVYGPALSSAMHGGGDCTYWRYNFFKDRQDYHLHVKTAFGMLDTLAAWGARDARVPRKIAVLKSRASEDWWFQKIAHGPPGNQVDRSRGFFAEKAVLETLLANGYPFVMYYLDRTEELADLADFKLILIPFAYSVPHGALPHLEKAARAGATILVFEKEGQVDEWGTHCAQSLLWALTKKGKVELLHEDLADHGSDPGFQRAMCKKFDKVLGEDKPLYLNRYGKDIEAVCLEKPNGDRLVLATNWTKKPAVADLGVNLPPGNYEMLKRGLTKATKVTLGGKEKLTEKDLRRFRVKLAPGEANVFLIRESP